MSKFDYIAYDEEAAKYQADFKGVFQALDTMVEVLLHSPRHKALTMTALETAYMWIGKAIRDDQISRRGGAELQEGRKDS